jgi:hypothetical protein
MVTKHLYSSISRLLDELTEFPLGFDYAFPSIPGATSKGKLFCVCVTYQAREIEVTTSIHGYQPQIFNHPPASKSTDLVPLTWKCFFLQLWVQR